MANKKRLGKGLEAIFGQDFNTLLDDIQEGPNAVKQINIPVEQLRANPYQPRKTFDPKALQELSDSILTHGIFQALIVRKAVNGYEIIAGERRWRAAKMAKLETVPCVVLDFSDEQMMEISILENIQRENLNAIEEALAYRNLIDKLGYTQAELSKRVNKTREYCANLLRLLNLPVDVQEYIVNGKLSMSHARTLLSLEDPTKIREMADRIMSEGLSVRDIEKMVKEKPKTSVKKEDANLLYVKDLLEKKLNTNIKVTNKQIVIRYEDVKDLNRILEMMGVIEE